MEQKEEKHKWVVGMLENFALFLQQKGGNGTAYAPWKQPLAKRPRDEVEKEVNVKQESLFFVLF